MLLKVQCRPTPFGCMPCCISDRFPSPSLHRLLPFRDHLAGCMLQRCMEIKYFECKQDPINFIILPVSVINCLVAIQSNCFGVKPDSFWVVSFCNFAISSSLEFFSLLLILLWHLLLLHVNRFLLAITTINRLTVWAKRCSVWELKRWIIHYHCVPYLQQQW